MTPEADPLDAIYPLPTQDLPRQWALSRDAGALPADWLRQSLRGWTLASHPDATVCRLTGADGTPFGWVLEPLLQTTSDGARLPETTVMLPGATASPDAAAIESALYGRDAQGHPDGTGLEGMWIAIVLTPDLARIYPGPTHSLLYDPEQAMAAASHNLLPHWRRDHALSRAVDALDTNRFFPLGLTAFAGVRRLLPNHYLDLETFRPVRHWPKAPFPVRDARETAAAMIAHGSHLLGAIGRTAGAVQLPLSAGRDSRAVLAMLRPFIGRADVAITSFTTVGADFGQRVDLQAARRLARIAGLPHETRQRDTHARASREAVLRHFARIGEARAGMLLSAPRLLRPADPAAGPRPLSVGGMAGELGRAFYWSDGPPDAIQPDGLLRRLRMPLLPRLLEAARDWLGGLPGFIRDRPDSVLDLAYVEQRMGCWEAPSRYLFPGRRPLVISPMASGFCIAAMLGLPRDDRLAGRLQRDMVELGWPALLAVPINRPTGLLRVEGMARRVLGRLRGRAAAAAPALAGL